MDILNDLKLTNLRNYCSPLPVSLDVPYNDAGLKTQSFHIVDEDKSRHLTISEVIINHLQKTSTVVILVDLDYSWNSKNQYYRNMKDKLDESQLERLKVIQGIDSVTDLIKLLKNFKNPVFYNENITSLNTRLGMIIIDNISIFHWSMVIKQHYPMEYKSLFQAATITQAYFSCVLITTSLNKFFETGLEQKNENVSIKNIGSIPFDSLKIENIQHSGLHRGKINGKLYFNGEVRIINK